jgi:hypothetical protein
LGKLFKLSNKLLYNFNLTFFENIKMATMQPTYGVGRVAPAGQMILEDHLKKCLSMTSAQQWKPYHNKNLPRA